MSSIPPTDPPPPSPAAIFFAGWRAAWTSVFALLIIGTFVGVGALPHEYGFSLWWLRLCTLVLWAPPSQVILLSALAAAATPLQLCLALPPPPVRLVPLRT